MLKRYLSGISFIWTWKFGCYRARVFCLERYSDKMFTRICVSSYYNVETRWKHVAIEAVVGIRFIWTWKFRSYLATVFGLPQQSDKKITWICFSQHRLDTRWKQNDIEGCRESILSGHESSVAIGLQFLVFNNSQMGQLLASVFRSTNLTQDGSKMQ